MADLFGALWQERIAEAITDPYRFAYRGEGETGDAFCARAVACALHYDDEQIADMGLPGAKRPAVNWRGEWDRDTFYRVCDGVMYEGHPFVAYRENQGLPPDKDGGTQWHPVLAPLPGFRPLPARPVRENSSPGEDTEEWTPGFDDEVPLFREPEMEGVTIHGKPPNLAVVATIVAAAALVLSVVSLMVN